MVSTFLLEPGRALLFEGFIGWPFLLLFALHGIGLHSIASTVVFMPAFGLLHCCCACLPAWPARLEQETIELKEAKKTYDRVFDPSATQQEVFDYVAKPLVSGEPVDEGRPEASCAAAACCCLLVYQLLLLVICSTQHVFA